MENQIDWSKPICFQNSTNECSLTVKNIRSDTVLVEIASQRDKANNITPLLAHYNLDGQPRVAGLSRIINDPRFKAETNREVLASQIRDIVNFGVL